MVLIATDVETFVQYDGSKEMEEYIMINSYDNGKDEVTGLNLQQKYFKENKKVGWWYPVLDSTKYALGCVWVDGNKNPVFFTDREEHYKYLLEYTLKRIKEGHNCYIYGHHASYDYDSIFHDHITETDKVWYDSKGSTYGYLGYTKTNKEEALDEENEQEEYTDKNGRKRKRRHPRGYLLDTKSFLAGLDESKSLASIGKALGCEKLNMPREVKSLNEIHEYLQRDVEIVMKFVKEIKRSLTELGHAPKKLLTAGNIATSYLRQYCDKKLICSNCNHIQDLKDEREKFYAKCEKCMRKSVRLSSYLYEEGRLLKPKTPYNAVIVKNAHRGGRNELFKKKGFEGKDITYLDINSLYPYVMINMHNLSGFPDLRSEFRLNPLMFTTQDTLNFIGVVDATVYFPERKLGYLGYRHKNGLFFPHKFDYDIEEAEQELRGMYEEGYECEELLNKAEEGTLRGAVFRGNWTTYELKEAQKYGYKILKIHNGVLYRTLPFNPFENLLKELYDLRLRSKGVMNKVVKLIMNNMYGKFAEVQTERKRALCERKDFPIYEKRGFNVVKPLGDNYSLLLESNPKLAGGSNPIITTLITALGRDTIFKELNKVAENDFDDLVYTDTDSIFLLNGKKHLDKFKLGTQLGEFKIEDVASGLFAREKAYEFGGKETETLKEEKKTSQLRLAGSGNRNVTKEQLLGKEPYYTQIRYGINMGFQTGNFEKIGTKIHKENWLRMDRPSKRETIFPFYNREGISPKLKKTPKLQI